MSRAKLTMITTEAILDAFLPLGVIISEPPLEMSARTSATDARMNGTKTGNESVENPARMARDIEVRVSLSRGD